MNENHAQHSKILLHHLVDTDDLAKKALYTRRDGQKLDYTTYFNSLDAKKWKSETTLETASLQLETKGDFQISFVAWTGAGREELGTETVSGSFRHDFLADELPDGILGFELTPLSSESSLESGGWYGIFSEWKNLKIGISICTFHREEYVRRTMSVLQEFQKDHDWLTVLVVDNGQTLPTQQGRIRVIHNPNYGGSGGFTRGLMEYVKEDRVDEILLMDDDIILEPSVLERTWAFLGGLKPENRERILGGAMLFTEHPTIQHENLSCWPSRKVASFYEGLDLSKVENLAGNGRPKEEPNQYAAWWYACIPMELVKKQGYPLPLFIKIDDIEYSVRSGKRPMSLNGVSVWHVEDGKKPGGAIIKYYADRNALILHHSLPGKGYLHQMYQVCGRIYKRIADHRYDDLHVFRYALHDYVRGLHALTSIPADQQRKERLAVCNKDYQGSDLAVLLKDTLWLALHYSSLAKDYRNFIDHDLKTSKYWEDYLRLGDTNR